MSYFDNKSDSELSDLSSSANAELHRRKEQRKEDDLNAKIKAGEAKTCGKCEGKGQISHGWKTMHWDYGHSSRDYEDWQQCAECKGKGYFEKVWG